MAADEILTPDEHVELEALEQRRKGLNDAIFEVERQHRAVGSRALVRLMKGCRWQLQGRGFANRLVPHPDDRAAERTVTKILMAGASLGWHDSFYLQVSEDLGIVGEVNDGEISLRTSLMALHATDDPDEDGPTDGSDPITDIFTTVGLDVDVTAWLIETLEAERSEADAAVDKASRLRAAIEDRLAALRSAT